jgi:hypothetical protein
MDMEMDLVKIWKRHGQYMDMQHGHGHEALNWTCSMDMDMDVEKTWT